MDCLALNCSVIPISLTICVAFINAIYVFDDKLAFTYNFHDGTETITLKEIEAAFGAFSPGQCQLFTLAILKSMRYNEGTSDRK